MLAPVHTTFVSQLFPVLKLTLEILVLPFQIADLVSHRHDLLGQYLVELLEEFCIMHSSASVEILDRDVLEGLSCPHPYGQGL